MELYIRCKPPKGVLFEEIAKQLQYDYLAEDCKNRNRKLDVNETASVIYNLFTSDKYDLSNMQKSEVVRVLLNRLTEPQQLRA